MASKFEQNLQKYAELAIRVGVNLRAGQRLLVRGGAAFGVAHDLAPLVHYITENAYKAGARLVDVMWGDEETELIRFRYAPRDSFTEFPRWKATGPLDYAERGDAVLSISATNPDLLAGQNPELIAAFQDTIWKETAAFSKYITSDVINWCVIAASRPAWATKVYPKLDEDKAVAKLWKTIFQMCRVDQDDPVTAWQAHIRNLKARSNYLTKKQYTALHYKAPGTDLIIGLPKEHLWASARSLAQNGVEFTANIPTEEAFTLADRTCVDGVVSSTKSLNLSGTLVEGIVVRFENGQVVEARAKKNESILQKTITTDEGASRLGEVALVPNSSPISKSGLMFHNTLFDENASSHLALGRAYKFTLVGGTEMTDEEFAVRGGNSSLIHVDFMVGSGQMDIDGLTADGRAEPVMRKGEWAFKV